MCMNGAMMRMIAMTVAINLFKGVVVLKVIMTPVQLLTAPVIIEKKLPDVSASASFVPASKKSIVRLFHFAAHAHFANRALQGTQCRFTLPFVRHCIVFLKKLR